MASGKTNYAALGPVSGAHYRSAFPPAKAEPVDPKDVLTDEQFDALWERMTGEKPDDKTDG